ncbi:MAG TPA: glycosyltransferase family 2 protein [Urbifossiella sp.]|nr:glycosyltransferase family 2 protein [Urbifossiella sp.]
MKLIIQIPCLNEAETLPATLAALPARVDGFDVVEVMVIDDGSTDGTAAVARAQGADHVIRMNGNQGLARAFMAGLATAVELGADVIVNTDADNQYRPEFIPALVRPVVDGEADLVIGARPVHSIRHFSLLKRVLQAVGSRVVRATCGADVRDAPSGFRAISRHAALRLNVFGDFTYTIETAIQAGLSNFRVVSVPVQVNPPTRPSRLFRSNLYYVCRCAVTIAAVYLIYRPVHLFGALALAFFAPGLFLGGRFLYLTAVGEGGGHVQSLIACAILVLSGVFMAAVGVIAHLQKINRQLLEELRFLARDRAAGGNDGRVRDRIAAGVCGR